METTMGLTPLGGVPMGSRSGDLDPSVITYLMRKLKNQEEKEEIASPKKQTRKKKSTSKKEES